MSEQDLMAATGGNPARADLFAIVWHARYRGEAEGHARTQADLLAHQQVMRQLADQIATLEQNINDLKADNVRLECDSARKQGLLDAAGLVDDGPPEIPFQPEPKDTLQ